jgi:hypothetical protein
MLMLFLCLTLHFTPEETLTLGAGQPWYEQDKTMPQQVEGILDYQSAGGRVGVPAGYRPFRVARQDAATGKVLTYAVHAPGHETTLALNVGQRVRVEGKIIAKGEGDARVEELWIGKLTTLGPAPANAFTEVKPLIRTNRFPFQISGGRGDEKTLVIRTAAELARHYGFQGIDGERAATTDLARSLGVKTIDWKNQMIICVGITFNGRTPNTKKVEITKLNVSDRGVTVLWKEEVLPLAQGRGLGGAYFSDTVLVPRIEGDVTFKKEETKDDGGPKAEKFVPDKIVVPRPPVK